MIKKGSSVKGKRCKLFGDFVDTCHLQDLGFTGPSFTSQRASTFERIDRALANDPWLSAFPQCRVLREPCLT